MSCVEKTDILEFEEVSGSINVIEISIDEPISSISSAEHHSCALTVTKSVFCWWNEVDDSSAEEHTNEPKLLIDGRLNPVRSISSAGQNSCFIQYNLQIDCRKFQIDGKVWPDSKEITDLETEDITTISLGTNISCFLSSNGEVGCWDDWSPIGVFFPFDDEKSPT